MRVERGHLILEDRIGLDRRYGQFSRVGHGLKRLVLIGSDGLVKKSQNVSLAILERDGSVLATTGRSAGFHLPATGLTQARRSLAKAGNLVANTPTIPKPLNRCQRCGEPVTRGSIYCVKCVPAINRERLIETAKLGRIATHSPVAEARRAATHMKHVEALRKWNPSDLPSWLDDARFPSQGVRHCAQVSHTECLVASLEVMAVIAQAPLNVVTG